LYPPARSTFGDRPQAVLGEGQIVMSASSAPLRPLREIRDRAPREISPHQETL